MPELPPELLHYLADSEIEVVSWSAERDEMVMQVTKELGPEVGLLRLRGVGLVHLRPRFDVVAIGVYDRPFPDYPQLELSDGEFALAFQEAWGAVYVVTAEAIEYEKTA